MEKRIAVIYKSTYGSTKKYAGWIAEELKADLLERKDVTIDNLMNYDTIIYGGSLHAAGILGYDIISKNFDKLESKKVIIFGVGCAPSRKDTINSVVTTNIPEQYRDKIKFFYLRGAFNFDKLNFIDKTLMHLLRMKIKFQKIDNADTKGLLHAYNNPIDWTKKENIKPLINEAAK